MNKLREHGSYLLVVLLAGLAGGCVSVSEEAQSDAQWKQYNPEWKSPTPPDPHAKWGYDPFGWPSSDRPHLGRF
jgi:hypothetical protein